MKKLWLVLCIITTLLLSSCSSKIHIPSQKNLISYMKDSGYTIDKFSTIGDINDISRIVATKGDSTLDVCYHVEDEDHDIILDFYGANYEKSYISGKIDGFVYYASDKTVWEISRIDTDIEN